MDKRPRIGVTNNGRKWSPSWWCTALALRLVGAIPERISVRHPPSGKQLDGLVIGGGDDISPEHYGGELTNKVKPDVARDQLEIEWIKWALTHQAPLLGICRGAQLINVVKKGHLYEDIRTIRQKTYNRPGLLPTKQVRLIANSMLAEVCKKNHLRVNSLHHQAIKNAGESLQVVGWDLDNLTQAIESQQENILGVQWHPEYLIYVPAQLRIFNWLATKAKKDLN
ncbi:gamma-glutamyl-gamma-aminobutyrate hydrolase family protein [Thalassotalea ganghwensis]